MYILSCMITFVERGLFIF